jgi:hypothetical protein
MLETHRSVLVLRCTSSAEYQCERALSLLAATKSETLRLKRQVATIYVQSYLDQWATLKCSKSTYVKYLSEKAGSFCLVQVESHSLTECLMWLTAHFYGTDASESLHIWNSLNIGMEKLEYLGKDSFCPIYVAHKPINALLIKYTRERDVVPNVTPARSYLLSKRWTWFSDIKQTDSITELLHQSFALLYRCRLEEKYLHISDLPGAITFFKEELVENQWICIQYALYIDCNNRLVTELWVEPCVVAEGHSLVTFFDLTAKSIFGKDRHELLRYTIL